MGETCVQYMFVFEEDLARPGFEGAKFVCSPPVRQPKDAEVLWKSLANNTLQAVSTDHAVFWYEGGVKGRIPGKELGKEHFAKIPNGMPGIEDRMPVLWTTGVRAGKITANQFVACNSTNPARIFGLYPRKGALLPGSDADIVIWDPEKKVKYSVALSHQRTDYNLYEGWELTGYPEKVFLRGQLIVDGEKWLGRAGMGRFITRGPGEIL